MPDEDGKDTLDLSALTTKVTELSTALEQAKTALTERETKIKELEGATGGLKTANGQLSTKLTDLETQLAAQTAAVQTQAGELQNWTTKFDQLNTTHATLATEAASDKQQLQLFGLIAGEPKYHGLVGVVDAIKTDPDPAKQKEILDKMAGSFTAQTNQALEAFRAGATLPAGQVVGAVTGSSLPTDPKAAFAEYQSLVSATTPEQMQRRAQLYQIVAQAEFGTENGKQQN